MGKLPIFAPSQLTRSRIKNLEYVDRQMEMGDSVGRDEIEIPGCEWCDWVEWDECVMGQKIEIDP